MPVQYTSILEEHAAVRKAAGLFDVSHMGEFHVTGHQAAAFLDKLLVNSIAAAPVGKAIYSPMCQRDGGVVDDLIVYRTDPEAFLICVNASNVEKDYGWLHQQAERWGMEVEIQDHSENYALLAVQGPKAATVLEAAGFESAGQLKRFTHEAVAFMGEKCRIARTGYTGEDGFEISLPADRAVQLAECLCADEAVSLAGLGARDTLRLEAGLPLWGHELDETITPVAAGLRFALSKRRREAGDFPGAAAIMTDWHDGPKRQLVGLLPQGGRPVRDGAELERDGAIIGHVTSGGFAPSLDAPAALGFIDTALATPGTDINALVRGHEVPVTVAALPLVPHRYIRG